jgi:hypothetical protein
MKQTLSTNYQALWSKYKNSHFQDVLDRGYAYHYDEDEQGSDILYVGINPSFSEGSKNENFVFDRNSPHSYFEPFRSIKKELENEPYLLKDIKWTHLDVLVFRKTNQKYIDTLFQKDNGIHFVYEQVMIARERIIHIQPKVIVVSNTKAKELMGKNRFKPENQDEEVGVWMDFQFEFDMENGSHRITNVPELAHTHVFFSSMLSGQRALDLGSRERLVWQIGRTLKMIN